MAKGRIKDIFPPNNDGSSHGAGQIDKKDENGNLTGPPYCIFHTPDGCVPPLSEGLDVMFEEGHGHTVTGVVKDDNPDL
ncbi:MAG: hypothetical protein ABII90_01680 [Bacteroidota bacterium]